MMEAQEMKKAGIDIGYFYTKGTNGQKVTGFPSFVGQYDHPTFDLKNGKPVLNEIRFTDPAISVGEGVVEYGSLLGTHREGRKWIESEEWYALFQGMLSELYEDDETLQIVTGLPVKYYTQDKDLVIQRMTGLHRFEREGRKPQVLTVVKVVVVEQPFGTVFAECLSPDGKIAKPEIAKGQNGVIDCGGGTVNLLHTTGFRDLPHASDSIAVGGWTVVHALADALAAQFPDLSLNDYELDQILRTGKLSYYGKVHEVLEVVAAATKTILAPIQALIAQKWNVAKLDRIFITGGGSLRIIEPLQKAYQQAIPVSNPIYANVIGFGKLAQRG
jgi:hypothetical protein